MYVRTFTFACVYLCMVFIPKKVRCTDNTRLNTWHLLSFKSKLFRVLNQTINSHVLHVSCVRVCVYACVLWVLIKKKKKRKWNSKVRSNNLVNVRYLIPCSCIVNITFFFLLSPTRTYVFHRYNEISCSSWTLRMKKKKGNKMWLNAGFE